MDEKNRKIGEMFSAIAPRYDFLNRLLSGGTDVAWRREAARLLAPGPGERVLDLCSGTGDLALAVRSRSRGGATVVAADFTFEMLALCTLAYLAVIPVSAARYRRLEREKVAVAPEPAPEG